MLYEVVCLKMPTKEDGSERIILPTTLVVADNDEGARLKALDELHNHNVLYNRNKQESLENVLVLVRNFMQAVTIRNTVAFPALAKHQTGTESVVLEK